MRASSCRGATVPKSVGIGELHPEQVQPRTRDLSREHHAPPPRRRPSAATRTLAETSLRPQRLSEFIGQQQARANLTVFIEAARARNEALDHVLFVGPPGPRQDHAGADRRARARRQFPRHLGAGDRQGRRSRGAAHQSGGARRSVHRRDPPAQSGGRGGALSGDGGFPARSHHRRGAGGALGEDRSVEVHPGRRHHARGPSHQSAARPLRHSGAAQLLHRGGARADRQPRRARARHRHDGGRRQRDRAALARHAAHRRTAVAPRARLRPCRRRRQDRPQARRPGAAPARSRRRRPRRHGPALSHDHRRALRRRAGRRRDAGGGAVGAARRHRGDHRAVPDPEGPPATHAARPADHRRTRSSISASPSRRAIRRSSGCSATATRASEGRCDANHGRRMPLRPRALPRHRRSRRRHHLQLLDLHQEGHLAPDRAAGAVRTAQRRGRSRDLSVQHQGRQASFLQGLRRPSVLCAALRPGQDRRQRPLPRRLRRARASRRSASTAATGRRRWQQDVPWR